MPTLVQIESLAEVVFAHAAFRQDPAARELVTRVGDSLLQAEPSDISRAEVHLTVLRAEAAIFLLEGKLDEAKALCREWLVLQAQEKPSWPGLRAVERDWIEQVLAT